MEELKEEDDNKEETNNSLKEQEVSLKEQEVSLKEQEVLMKKEDVLYRKKEIENKEIENKYKELDLELKKVDIELKKADLYNKILENKHNIVMKRCTEKIMKSYVLRHKLIVFKELSIFFHNDRNLKDIIKLNEILDSSALDLDEKEFIRIAENNILEHAYQHSKEYN